MSIIDAKMLARLIAEGGPSAHKGLSAIDREFRRRMLLKAGVEFDENRQVYINGNKQLSVEGAMFGFYADLERFLKD